MAHLKYPKNHFCKAEFCKYLEVSPSSEPHEKRRRLSSPKTPPVFSPVESVNVEGAAVSLEGAANSPLKAVNLEENEAFVLAEDDDIFVAIDEEIPPAQYQIPPLEAPEPAQGPTQEANNQPISEMMNNFKAYVNHSAKNRSWLNSEMEAAIELMHLLHKHGAPLCLYDVIFNWHITHLKAEKRVTRDSLMKKLRKRYNMKKSKPYVARVRLPSNNLIAKVPCHKAPTMIVDLLSDPRIQPEDYLWFNGDPYGDPPDEWTEIADINDALAYRKTYEKVIMPKPYTDLGRRRVLLPIILYMDSCVTGWNENLAIELVKFTLGIFTSKARDKDYTWRNLGAIPQFQKVKAKAAELIQESQHVDADGYVSFSESEPEDGHMTRDFDYERYIDSSESDEEAICDLNIPDTEAQNLHVILKVIMSGMKQIMDQGGFEWDQFHNSEVRKLHFVPFILFIKGDTVEHDKHTGHYGSRNKGIKNLCRYCVCPNDQTDEPYVDFERKNPKMVSDLVRKKDYDGLKEISQKDIFNVWYEFDFGQHNDLGVHGACPMEHLHWIQLGMFKYARSSFFDQTGVKSELSKTINLIATQMGYLFQRQSDREYPRTKFTKGVQKGSLMAHEMTGVILVLIAVLRSTRGREALLNESRRQQSTHFATEQDVIDWIMLLETQIQFEAWLKSPSMRVDTVIRLRTKVRELMYLTKHVGKRVRGMGYKTNNFHATKHVPDDILLFGPAHVVNTKSNEMHHKPDKKSAHMTQKRPGSFDIQCAERVDDRRVIEMGIQEMKGRPRWGYFKGFDHPSHPKSARFTNKTPKQTRNEKQKQDNQPITTGVKVIFRYNDDGELVYEVNSKMKRKSRYQYPDYVVHLLEMVAAEVGAYTDELVVYSELVVPSGQMYRASPYYQGKPWYDWAKMQLTEPPEGFEPRVVPVQIRGFVDLTFLPPNNTSIYSPAIHLLVEPTRLNPDLQDVRRSDLFVPYLKDENYKSVLKMAVLPVGWVHGPACVIPDLSHGTKRGFLSVRQMSEWAILFENWVHSAHAFPFQENDIGK